MILNPLFPLGRVVATATALASISSEEIAKALSRHARGDWGDLCAEDQALNTQGVSDGSRLLSAYESAEGTRFWIITEWDRSATTVLLPSDY